MNLEKKGKVALNLLETIPSSSGNDSEGAKPINIVTRAQAIEEEKSKRSSPDSWKARRQRRVYAKKRREEKAQEEARSQKKESLIKGGLVLVEKVFKPLKAMLDVSVQANYRSVGYSKSTSFAIRTCKSFVAIRERAKGQTRTLA